MDRVDLSEQSQTTSSHQMAFISARYLDSVES